jgi:LysM repeat protein
MKHFFLITGLCVAIIFSAWAQANTIKHTIQQGETLYSIARKYKADIKQLYELNNITDREYKVKLGEVILVPADAASAATEVKTNTAPVVKEPVATIQTSTGKHEVKSGETLFRIAKLYNTTPETIKQMNGLSGDGLNLGQVLKVPGAGNSVQQATTTSTNNANTASIKLPTTKTPVVTEEEKKEVVVNKETFVKDFNNNEASYLDKGMAEWIEDGNNDGGTRFFAMHKTAPVGTILKVRNLMNDKTAYVKVVGKMPESDANRNTLIKVSAATAKYLEVVDPKFLVEISYVNKKI